MRRDFWSVFQGKIGLRSQSRRAAYAIVGWLNLAREIREIKMGSYSDLLIDNYSIVSFKNYIFPMDVLTIFREEDKLVYIRNVVNGEIISGLTEDEILEDDDLEIAHTYTTSAKVVKQRLQVIGYSIGFVRDEFERNLPEVCASKENTLEIWRGMGGTSKDTLQARELKPIIAHHQKELDILKSSTFEDWLDAYNEVRVKKLDSFSLEKGEASYENPLVGILFSDTSYLGYSFPGCDIRCAIRAFLEICPDDVEVVQDLTDLVMGGWIDPDDKVCESAHESLLYDYPVNERVLILAEGSTDIHAIEQSMKLLYPHLYEYYSFMDFGLSNAPGSAGALVNTVKAFAGSGIRNRTIAIFDNDTAAQTALRGLSKTIIPANIRVMKYPDLPIANNYPTLGPSGINELNINGLALSIEMFFGMDVLTDDEGNLIPVQWKGYVSALGQYQGEISNKQNLQNKFFSKIDKCNDDKSFFDQSDWEPMKTLLESIIDAYS